MTNKSPFKPLPGFLICKPFIDKDDTFKSEREISGDCQISEVIAVGDDYIDDHGNSRNTKVKIGDTIVHLYESNTFTIKFDKYRAVHFSRVIGIK
jgi:co-chaperonin GroES (HSP10)